MSKTVLHLSVSLDGFAAGLDTSAEHPLGIGGEALHQWFFGTSQAQPSEIDLQQSAAMLEDAGAFILGRTMFDVGEPLWGADGAFRKPCFVVTSRPKQKLFRGPSTFNFVTGGIREALEEAQSVAGDLNVSVVGGPTTARQFLAEDLIDEMILHLVPLTLKKGVRLFDETISICRMLPAEAISTDLAVHLRFVRRRAEEVSRGN